MKEVLKEIIVSNQNAMPADVKVRSWEIPMDTVTFIFEVRHGFMELLPAV